MLKSNCKSQDITLNYQELSEKSEKEDILIETQHYTVYGFNGFMHFTLLDNITTPRNTDNIDESFTLSKTIDDYDKLHIAVENNQGNLELGFRLIVQYLEQYVMNAIDNNAPLIQGFKFPLFSHIKRFYIEQKGKFCTIYTTGFNSKEILDLANEISDFLVNNYVIPGPLATGNKIGRVDIPLNTTHATYSEKGKRSNSLINCVNGAQKRRPSYINSGIISIFSPPVVSQSSNELCINGAEWVNSVTDRVDIQNIADKSVGPVELIFNNPKDLSSSELFGSSSFLMIFEGRRASVEALLDRTNISQNNLVISESCYSLFKKCMNQKSEILSRKIPTTASSFLKLYEYVASK